MNLIGGWLPFIGFRDLMRDDEGDMFKFFGFDQDPSIIGIHAFELEWFHRGVTLFISPIYAED